VTRALAHDPARVDELTGIAKNLRGVTPQRPMLTINPENWHFAG